MFDFQFENPEFLFGLLVLPLLAFWFWYKRKGLSPELHYPEADFLAAGAANWFSYLRHLLPTLRLLAIGLAIVALARPRTAEEQSKSKDLEGIDIVMALDVSASMLSQDLRPNRLEATKQVATDFINDRPNDRIGLAVYAGESFTQTPLTSDHKVLKNALLDLRYGLIEDGTAIGMGLATAVNRLKESAAKSKVIILLTDGENNRGEIAPLTAAQLAQEFNIRVYTIGVGSKGQARSPVAYLPGGGFRYGMVQVNIDEELLTQIAEQTGGRYFRATNNQKLKEIYTEIDSLEKTKLQELKFYTYDEKFSLFALWALGLFCAEVFLRYTLLKSFV
jgi:Ca-activated chloride channel family protein